MAGIPFELIDWQEQIIRDLFGTLKPNGYRQFNTAYIEIPKKQGKSELAAAVALLLTCGDGEERAEVYGCAADRQQAAIVFDVAADMVRMCPALSKRVKILASQKRLIYTPTNSFYQVLSAEAYSKHGFNIHGVVFDELHTQPNRKLFDVMTKGSGDARMQPLYFLITTAGTDTHSICYETHQKAKDIIAGRKIDPTFYPVIYGADESDDWTDPKVWKKANPSLDITVGIDKVKAACDSAKQNPGEENAFRQLRLNQWVKQAVRWMPMEKWDKCAFSVDEDELEGRVCYGGLDLSSETKKSEFEISYLLKLNPKEEESQFLSFLAKATPQKQLFLHEVMSRNIHENVSNIKDLDAVIDWFVNSLKIIFPDTPYKQGVLLKAADDNDLKRGFGALLRYFNTGVDGVKLIDVQFEKLGIPHDLQRAIKTDLSKSNTDEAFGALRFDDNLYLINLIDGEIRAKKLMTVHKKMDEADIELFSLGDESDGTKRLFDYIPLILDLIQGGKVFIVDEMERSLHPSLIKQIILLFYKYSKDVSSQLIFTTHESSLMDQKIFRRDEIWLMKKDNNGISSFGRMDNLYNVRFDKMLQNSYLNGEYGATPIFETEEEINKLFSSLK